MSLPLTDMGRKSGEDTVSVIIIIIVIILIMIIIILIMIIIIIIIVIIIMGTKSSEVDGKLAFLE